MEVWYLLAIELNVSPRWTVWYGVEDELVIDVAVVLVELSTTARVRDLLRRSS
jgi:hypothetical protein